MFNKYFQFIAIGGFVFSVAEAQVTYKFN